MRARTGCQPCRDRHVKCVKRAEDKKCQKCADAQRECVLDSPLYFRPVKSVRLKTTDGRRVKHDLRHRSHQVWVDIPEKVRFVSSDFDSDISDDLEVDDGKDAPELVNTSAPDFPPSPSFEFPVEEIQPSQPAPEWINNASPHQSDHQSASVQSLLQHNSPPTPFSPQVALSLGLSPAQSAGRSRTIEYASPSLMNTNSPHYGLNFSWPFTDLNEARLIHHYIIYLSPQFDSCDRQSHFGKEIPKRAAYYPILKNAIFAVATRQIGLLRGSETDESHRYVNECLRILITALEDPLSHLDENLLAAVILLRTHEEMSENDERCHLFGTTRLLNSIASFAADGGLRESASWVSLRQHIYISLTEQHPLTINLTNYRDSAVWRTTDDESWANRIIFTFARILTYIFNEEVEGRVQGLGAERWAELSGEVESWEMSKPWHFAPLFMATGEEKDVDTAAASRGSVWPELFVCSPAQVVGLQHYYLAKIVLSIYNPRLSRLSFGSHRLRKESEAAVRKNLRMVIGLAVSNNHVYTAMFQASHILSACGSYLVNPEEQQAAVDFLVQMNQRMGWETSHIVRDLKEQWQT